MEEERERVNMRSSTSVREARDEGVEKQIGRRREAWGRRGRVPKTCQSSFSPLEEKRLNWRSLMSPSILTLFDNKDP